MARCGCGSSAVCSCVLHAGTGISILGSGSPGSPYVITATATGVTVLNSSTINFSLVGQQVSGSVKLDPAGGNLISVAAGGLRLDCGDVQTCFSNGNGIDTIISGVIQALTSTDAGNTLIFGSDNGLYVPPGSFGGASVGCGILGDGTLLDPLLTNTPAIWPFACADTEGADVYCSGVDGQLRTAPPIAWTFDEEFFSNTFGAIAVPLAMTTVDTTTIVSSAPGTCSQEVGRISEIEFQATLSIPDGTRVQGFYNGDEMWDIVNQTGSTMSVNSPQICRTFFRTVAAGSASGQLDFQMQQSGVGGATYSRLQHAYRLAYITTQTP